MTAKKNALMRSGEMIRNIAIYAAGAWAVIQAVDFLVFRYFLGDERLINASIFAAAVGAGIVIVVTWFHGQPGQQRSPVIEKILVLLFGVSAIAGAVMISTADPYEEFRNADGFRIAVAFRNDRSGSGGKYGFRVNLDYQRSLLTMAEDPDGTFYMDPKDFKLTLPGVIFEGARTPIDIRYGVQREYALITTILPKQPEDLAGLLEKSNQQQAAHLEYGNMKLTIDRPFVLEATDKGVLFKITGPLNPSESDAAN